MRSGDNPLQQARLRKGIPLSQLAARTLLSPRIVEKIDAGRFGELPGGVYARSYIRAYASAVGLDPDDAVRALDGVLPAADDPFPLLREIARAKARASRPKWFNGVRVAATSATTWTSLTAAATVRIIWRTVAAAIDASILLTIQAVLIKATAWMCGVRPQVLLEFDSAPIAAVWGFLVMAYFVILGSIGGRRRALVCRVPTASTVQWPSDGHRERGRAPRHRHHSLADRHAAARVAYVHE